MNYLSSRYGPERLPHALLIQGSSRQVKQLVEEYIAELQLSPADLFWLLDNETIKVAEIRQLLQFAGRSRSTSLLKLITIPDATQLTIEAANALLKTLEEPPPYTHFVLGAANPEDLLPTIQSRCQLIQLPTQQPTNDTIDKLRFHSLSEAFSLSKTLAAGDTALDTLLKSWAEQSEDPEEQELILTYLTYLSTNPNRRLFLDNLFLERYNRKLKPQR